VLAIGWKVRGFKPGQGRRIFKRDKIRKSTSSRREVNPSASCLKSLQHVKDPAERDRDISQTKLVDFFAKFLPVSLLGVSVDFPESSGG
jgi:hypothetical protein